MKLIIASNNKDKIREIKNILSDFFNEIISMKEAGIVHETIEDGETFAENAYKKAKEICEISNCPTLADDSGICINALDGKPGIYSARFCGEHGNDEKNNQLVLEKLKNKTDRSAYYACAMCLVMPDGKIIESYATFEGNIAHKPIGKNGFGYDPLFYPLGYDKTVAQLTDEEKNKISHRAKALNILLEKIKQNR